MKKKLLVANSPKIKDPIIQAFADTTTNTILYSFKRRLLNGMDNKKFRFAQDHLPNMKDKKGRLKPTPESIILKYLKKTKSKDTKRTFKNINRVLRNKKIELKNLQNIIKLTAKESIYDKKIAKKIYADIPLKKITDKRLNMIYLEMFQMEEDTEPDPIIINKGIKFRLHSVKCNDATNGEWGSDEISMGAVFTNPIGENTIYNEFQVHNDFDTGEQRNYPPLVMKTFNMPLDGFPQTYTAVLALAEQDQGGMADFIQELYASIEDHVQEILTALGLAAGAAIGAQIGGSLGTAIGGPLGAIIGVVAGAILGAVVGALVGILKDDIFPPQIASISLPAQGSSFAGGSLTSQIYSVNFIAHGGFYTARYSWKINR